MLIQIPTFLHVSKALFKLMIYFWSKGKVIHKNNTGRERKTTVVYYSSFMFT